MRSDSISTSNIKNRIGNKLPPEKFADVRHLLEEKRQHSCPRPAGGSTKPGTVLPLLCSWLPSCKPLEWPGSIPRLTCPAPQYEGGQAFCPKKKSKIWPQNPTNPRPPYLYKAGLLLSSLLSSRGSHPPVSFPINLFWEVCCAVWPCGIHWLPTARILSPQSSNPYTSEHLRADGLRVGSSEFI